MTASYLAIGNNPSSSNSNFCNCRLNNGALTQSLAVASASTTATALIMAMRWTLPSAMTATNFRGAQLQFSGFDSNDGRNDLHADLFGEKVANPGVFTGSSVPSTRAAANPTTNTIALDIDNLPPQPQMLNIDVTAMVQEIINVSGWVPGNAIAFFIKGRIQPTTMTQWVTAPNSSTPDLYGPRLSVTYGDVSSDAIDFDLGFIGNSHPAYAGHAGQTVTGITVPIFGSTTLTGPAGMKPSTGIVTWYGGDNFRGWVAGGFVQTAMETKWGTKVQIFRAEHALAGSTAAQWAADAGLSTGGKWGDVTVNGTLRYRLKHPRSASQRQLWVAEWLGNDALGFGGGTLLWAPPDAPGSLCEDLWTARVTAAEGWLRTCLDEFWNNALHPEKTWMYLIGAPRFPMKWSGTDSPLHYYCSSQIRDLFRSGAGIQDQGQAYKQLDYDSGVLNADTLHYGHAELSYQSARVQAAARWQQTNHPEEVAGITDPELKYNPNGTFWSAAVLASNINMPSTGVFANANWTYPTGTDRWEQSLRNCTDIKLNYRVEQLFALYERVLADYPNLIYVPTRQMLGIDTTYSADPTSPLAQSDGSLWVEGIHPNLSGLNAQFVAPGAQLDQMTRAVGFMQPLSTMFTRFNGSTEDAIHIQGKWDGSVVQPCHLEGIWDGTTVQPPGNYEVRS